MENTERHVGFHADAPTEVAWSPTSFIRPVAWPDRRNLKCFTATFNVCILAFLAIFCAAGLLGTQIEKHLPGTIFAIILVLCLLGFFSCLVLGLLGGHVLKWVLIRKLRTRTESLFAAAWDCTFVGIEDAFTYQKRKLAPDDLALMKITSGSIQLEMENHRAQFDFSDLTVSIFHLSKSSAGVRLTMNRQPHTWSVVLTPLGAGSIFSSVKRARALLDQLVAAGGRAYAQATTPAAPVAVSLETPLEVQTPAADSPYEHGMDPNADLMEQRYQEVRSAIVARQRKKTGWFKQLGVLLMTLLIFYQLGARNWGMEGVLLILAVLVVHEAGHYIAMKLSGYSNVQMFFIPMLGAAVSGRSRNAAAWKKAAVTLAGPLPGIFIGFVLLILSMVLQQNMYLKLAGMFIGINLFNLLPIYPLDGGRFLHEVLFVRNRHVELIANILATLAMLGAGFALNSWFFKILGFFGLFTLQLKFKMAKTGQQLRVDLPPNELDPEADEEEIPESVLRKMLDWMSRNMPGPLKPAAAANMAVELWQRVRIRPPGAGATVALLFVFAMGYGVSVLGLGGLAVYYALKNPSMSRIVSYAADDGTTHYKEQTYLMGKLSTETELTDDRQYYHGKHTTYHLGVDKIMEEGQWDTGRRAGLWLAYNEDGVIVARSNYEDGRPVLTQVRDFADGTWKTLTWNDYSESEKALYEKRAGIAQGPNVAVPAEWYELLYDPNDSDSQEEASAGPPTAFEP